jgi:hypothetical protein
MWNRSAQRAQLLAQAARLKSNPEFFKARDALRALRDVFRLEVKWIRPY